MYQMVQKCWERVRNSVHVRAGLIEPQGVMGVRWVRHSQKQGKNRASETLIGKIESSVQE